MSDGAAQPKVIERPDYAEAVKQKDPGSKKHPYLRPRPAATLIILDHAGEQSKVLMGRRHHGSKFMPGKFVFPGGRVDPADRRVAITHALHPEVEEKLAKRRVKTSSAQSARCIRVSSRRPVGCQNSRTGERADLNPRSARRASCVRVRFSPRRCKEKPVPGLAGAPVPAYRGQLRRRGHD